MLQRQHIWINEKIGEGICPILMIKWFECTLCITEKIGEG
jgi:hypothetical protein